MILSPFAAWTGTGWIR